MAALTKGDLKQPRKIRVERIPMHRWMGDDDFVCLRPLSARDLRDLRKEEGAMPELGNLSFVYALLWRSICDEAGNRLFESSQDVADGFDLPIDALEFLTDEAMRVGGLRKVGEASPQPSATPTPSAGV